MPTKSEIINKIKQISNKSDNGNVLDEFGNEYTKPELTQLKKSQLEDILDHIEANNIDLDNIEPINENKMPLGKTLDQNIQLNTTSPKWTDHVLKQFTEDELIDGKPTCDGLRRVFECLIGEIIESYCTVIKPPSLNDYDATVTWTIRYRCYGGCGYNYGTEKMVSDCFNVNKENTKGLWWQAAAATAATKAEARALRKGLRLQKVLSREEDDGLFIDTDSTTKDSNKKITENQKIAIRNMSTSMDISIPKLLTNLNLLDNLDFLNCDEAKTVLKILNDYQRGPENAGLVVPKELTTGSDLII